MSRLASLLALLLVGSTPVNAEGIPKDAADPPPHKRICKKVREIGSLVKARKICLTAPEWRRAAEQAQALGQEMQSHIATERGN